MSAPTPAVMPARSARLNFEQGMPPILEVETGWSSCERVSFVVNNEWADYIVKNRPTKLELVLRVVDE